MSVVRNFGILLERLPVGFTHRRVFLVPPIRGTHSANTNRTDKRSLAKVTLFSKPTGCSLCVVAKKALQPFTNRIELIEIDITLPENRQWFEKYKYEIPVVHFGSQFLMKHFIDTKLLETALLNWEKEEK